MSKVKQLKSILEVADKYSTYFFDMDGVFVRLFLFNDDLVERRLETGPKCANFKQTSRNE